jgi:hypothetical protein
VTGRHAPRSGLRHFLIPVLVTLLALAGLGGVALAAPPAAAPAPVGPADGASVTIPFTISWTAPGDPAAVGGYNWQVSRTADFATVIERNPVLLSGTTTSDVVSGLPDGGWFWRVQAVSRAQEPGPWSAPRSVVVTGAGAGVPGTPVLSPPRGGPRFHVDEIITFSWTAVPGAVDYVLQESTDPSFPVDTRVRQVNLLGTTAQVSFNASNQGTFQARVLAVNAEGLLGTPSNLVSFSVLDSNPLPAPPTLVGPLGGGTQPLAVTLTWNHVANPQQHGYQVQISTNSSFSSVERSFGDITDAALVVPTLTAGTKFWRVRSQHGYIGIDPAYTAWSATGSFTVPATAVRMGSVTFPGVKYSGGEARGSVALTGPAPADGAVVTFSTDRPDLLPELPDARDVAAGDSSAQIVVFPNGIFSMRGMRVGFVTAPTTVTVTATYNGTSASTPITLVPPRLNDTPFQQLAVKATGGTDMSGNVDLEGGCFGGFCDGLAPPGGFTASLSTSSPAATVPATVTIPAGAGGTSFPIRTSPVSTTTTITITARAGDAIAAWRITLTPPPPPDTFRLDPAETAGDSRGIVTIPLSATLGYDQRLRVTSSNPAVAAVPEFVTIPASQEGTAFPITTGPVTTRTVVTITVTGGDGVSRTAELAVSPNLVELTALTVSPTSVPGGALSTGTVTLGSAAPNGGVTVGLGSNLPAAAGVPASVTVPAGATSATFRVTTSPVDATTSVQLSATFGSTTRLAALEVTFGPALSTLTLSPTTVVGGPSSTGTVTLSSAAAGGAVVTLLSDNTRVVTVPGQVAVAAGATSRTFDVTTFAVTAPTAVVITASSGGVTRSATLTVNPPTPQAPLLASPVNLATGVAQPVTLDWTDLPDVADYEVQVDDSSAMSAPFVANPTTTVSQTTLTGLPGRQLWWRVHARNAAGVFGPFSATFSFTPQGATTAPSLSTVSLAPTSVVGGASATGTVTLTAAAPAGGLAVTLADNSAAVTVPAGVTVAAGQTSATFTATTSTVTATATATITATAGAVSRTAGLTVTAAATRTLAAPSLQSPADDARFTRGQAIAFDWSDVAGAAGYTIQIDDQSSFASPTVGQAVTASAYSSNVLPVARMWWRVRATDAAGNPGAWSAVRRLEVR